MPDNLLAILLKFFRLFVDAVSFLLGGSEITMPAIQHSHVFLHDLVDALQLFF